jgi:hypothetical protein
MLHALHADASIVHLRGATQVECQLWWCFSACDKAVGQSSRYSGCVLCGRLRCAWALEVTLAGRWESATQYTALRKAVTRLPRPRQQNLITASQHLSDTDLRAAQELHRCRVDQASCRLQDRHLVPHGHWPKALVPCTAPTPCMAPTAAAQCAPEGTLAWHPLAQWR